MNKQDVNIINDTLSVLANRPLRRIGRGGASIFISFGELVETDCFYRDEYGKTAIDENGKPLLKKRMVGKYKLHIESFSRFICGDSVVIGKSDIFEQTEAIEGSPDFNWDDFDWDVKGNNRFDELTSRHFGEDDHDFIVNKIMVNKLGDIKIYFANSFVLEVINDVSSDREAWRFFEANSDYHLVVTGNGIERCCDDEKGDE